MWYFTWILGVLLACAFGIINVLWLEAQEGLDQETAVLDPLTKLPTRVEFLQTLEENFDQYQNDQMPFSMLLVSLNTSAATGVRNDSQQTDQAIMKLAEIIKQETRKPIDSLARYDSETFAVILPGAKTKAARLIAKRICENAADLSDSFYTSVGIAEYPADSSCGTDSNIQERIRVMLQTTDQALKTAQKKTELHICCAAESA